MKNSTSIAKIASETRTIIFSVAKQENAEIDAINHVNTVHRLNVNGIAFQEVHGFYEGEKEISIAAVITTLEEFELIREIAQEFNQDCVMTLGALHNIKGTPKRTAHLLGTNHNFGINHIVELGIFQPTSKKVALEQIGYTYSPNLNQYYSVL